MKISCRLFFPIEIVMTLFIYDKTLDGLLTAVFDAYYRKTFPDVLLTDGEALPLFYDEVFTVITDDEGRTCLAGIAKKSIGVCTFGHYLVLAVGIARGGFTPVPVHP